MRRPQHLTLVAALLCCGLSLPGWAQQAPGVSAQAATVPSRTSVGVARLDTVWIQPEREAPASVIARNESKLSAEVSGTLLRWTADVGAQVARGQVLAQIDPRDAELAVQRAQAALDASQARLKLAQAQLQRSRDLVAQGFFSQEALAQRETEVTLVQTELSTSRAQLATAQRQLAKTTLRAPFAGSVKERLAQTGESVAPGSVLYVLSESG
ncbi:MAG: efflux RND transporter periplasmic adaptor subunit, partial [Variovorax sp.]|nr:efflux RND transporter periplasmic adaptor subunit [Variovorax sp.]